MCRKRNIETVLDVVFTTDHCLWVPNGSSVSPSKTWSEFNLVAEGILGHGSEAGGVTKIVIIYVQGPVLRRIPPPVDNGIQLYSCIHRYYTCIPVCVYESNERFRFFLMPAVSSPAVSSPPPAAAAMLVRGASYGVR